MTAFCRVCGLALTPNVEVRDNRYLIAYRCPDHPHADQDGRETPREIEGD